MFSKQVFKFAGLTALFFLLLEVSSCGMKPGTMGAQHRIFVVADSLLWEETESAVRNAFERILYTPHEEKSFDITRIPLEELNALNDRMNIVLMGISDGKGAVDQYLGKYLPAEFKQGVAEGSYFYSFNDDMFARDQIGLIMLAPDKEAFLNNLSQMQDEIFTTFNQKYFARLEKSIFERDEQEKLQDYLDEHFGWHVRLQQDYFVALQDIENKFVWLRRLHPNRWISIWETDGMVSEFNLDSLKQIRNQMAEQYYQGDIVVDEDLRIEILDFNGQPAHKLIGLWQNDSLVVGGPFRMYALSDPANNKVRFIDIAVMAPGKLKKPFLDQLEVIAHTFRLAE